MSQALRNRALGTVGAPQAAAGAGLVLVAAALVLAAGRLGPYPSLLQGWLLAVAICSCAPIGSMTLLLVHGLTGGRWGVAAGPILRPLAAMMPLVTVAFVPILASLTSIYPWAADPGSVKPDVASWYLSQPSFILRALVALVGWSVLGVTFAVGAGGRLLAALGLSFFGLMISTVAVDWFLSVEPHYVATAFPAMMAVQQMMAALAVVAMLGTLELEDGAASDIASLIIATLLGVVYLEYMTFVVAWYGDLPHKAHWFLKRSTDPWGAALVVAFAAGAVLPFAMLLLRKTRRSRAGLRIVGVLLLIGTTMHLAWLIVPAFAAQTKVAVTGIGLLVVLTFAAILFGRGTTFAEARRAE